mmetsp:Transcript_5443/g.10383  ORF Transcript_5443/g.10383 Transcript_5443/m.10383 type:complete len:541 (+) Transcript_5443:88-1710(+)|eukprot:CAMPEP_0175146644 /NCGR_PEP_ID=MMETSP0087-20121206/15495_1 /TAXON_ID=136419 /ORGANISM="Unknown Unknown, Strain D1" /LENGTH=540 /DNA_ID=CAMNT_0016431633 /DNA_START=81 /DNA_END=1703 /DNA_ORIENTATION=-
MSLGQDKQMISDCLRKIQETPYELQPYLTLARLYSTAGDDDNCRKVLEKGAQYFPNDSVLQNFLNQHQVSLANIRKLPMFGQRKTERAERNLKATSARTQRPSPTKGQNGNVEDSNRTHLDRPPPHSPAKQPHQSPRSPQVPPLNSPAHLLRAASPRERRFRDPTAAGSVHRALHKTPSALSPRRRRYCADEIAKEITQDSSTSRLVHKKVKPLWEEVGIGQDISISPGKQVRKTADLEKTPKQAVSYRKRERSCKECARSQQYCSCEGNLLARAQSFFYSNLEAKFDVGENGQLAEECLEHEEQHVAVGELESPPVVSKSKPKRPNEMLHGSYGSFALSTPKTYKWQRPSEKKVFSYAQLTLKSLNLNQKHSPLHQGSPGPANSHSEALGSLAGYKWGLTNDNTFLEENCNKIEQKCAAAHSADYSDASAVSDSDTENGAGKPDRVAEGPSRIKDKHGMTPLHYRLKARTLTFYRQLTTGCKLPGCHNPLCASCPSFALSHLTTAERLSRSLKLVQQKFKPCEALMTNPALWERVKFLA